jgi:glycosyltransferase involved in cell wall biosynthesis
MNDAISNQERPLSVAFLSPSWPSDSAANGIATYVGNIVAGLRRMGHRPCILSVTGSGQWPDVYFLERESRPFLSRIFDPLAFRVAPRSATRRRHAENLFRAAARVIEERGVELLVMEETFGMLQLIRSRLSIPVVVRLCGPLFANGEASETVFDSAFRRRVRQEGVTISLADAVSASSANIIERTRVRYGLALDGASVIPAPAPIVSPRDRWRLDDCDRNHILFVGRFDRHKGGDVVIDCFRILARKFPRLKLRFVGADAGFRDNAGRSWPLAKYIAQHAPEVAGRVDWLGQQPHAALAALRRQSYLTIVASRFEVFGLVVVEALAYGCPLVATNTGGIPEIVTDGVNGLLCEPGDATAMATQVTRLLENPNLAAKLGERGGDDAATRYHPDTIAAKTASFHSALIERWRSRSDQTFRKRQLAG